LIVRKLRRPFDLPEPPGEEAEDEQVACLGHAFERFFHRASEFNELPPRFDRLIFQRLDAFDVWRGATPLQTQCDIGIDRTIIKGVAVPVAKLAQFLGSRHRLGRLPPNLYWPQGVSRL
jgi:hypothetical protein